MRDCSDLFNDIEWQPLSPSYDVQQGEDFATHQGALQVNEFHIRCYKASDQRNALDVEDIERFFRGCPNCDAPSECRHCNSIANTDEDLRVAIVLNQDEL